MRSTDGIAIANIPIFLHDCLMKKMAAIQENSLFNKQITKRFVVLWLMLLMAVAAYIRVHGAGEYHYNPDELMISDIANGKNVAEVIQFSRYETHPPFYYIVCHFWMMISTDPAFVRGLSLFFGLLLIPLYYRIGKLISGELNGLICATLIVFSYGCIVQSYLVRHYIIFLTLASLALYYSLLWHRSRTNSTLAGYVICGALACITHFSGIFFISCIALSECVALRPLKASATALIRWLFANGLILLVATGIYYLWQPLLAPLRHVFYDEINFTTQKIILCTLFYPVAVAGYILPNYSCGLVILILLGIVAAKRPDFVRKNPAIYQCLCACGLGFALGMVLIATGIYPVIGTQRSLWVLPLLIPVAGSALGAGCTWASANLKLCPKELTVVLMLLAGWISYDPVHRFTDRNYDMTQKQWQSLSDYLDTLGPSDMIVTQRTNAILLKDAYPYMDNRSFTGVAPAIVVPFRNTRLLFDQFYPHEYSANALPGLLQEGAEEGLLKEKDRVAIFITGRGITLARGIINCPLPDKQVVAFPFPNPRLATQEKISGSYAMIVTLPVKTLLNDVLAPQGKEHSCLVEKHS